MSVGMKSSLDFSRKALAQERGVLEIVGLSDWLARVLEHAIPVIATEAAERRPDSDAPDELVRADAVVVDHFNDHVDRFDLVLWDVE